MSDLYMGKGNAADFFAHGNRLARAADNEAARPDVPMITVEDPSDVAPLLTEARIGMFRAIKSAPASITAIAELLHRDRSAVKRDVDVLNLCCLVSVETAANAGHGTHKLVRAVARRFDSGIGVHRKSA